MIVLERHRHGGKFDVIDDDDEWASLNPRDFKYGYGGKHSEGAPLPPPAAKAARRKARPRLRPNG